MHASAVLQESQELPDSLVLELDEKPSLPPGLEPVSNTADLFPTDSKERQTKQKNADKAAGIIREVKKKVQHVEDHNDDCGEDISSLTTDAEDFMLVESDSDDSSEWNSDWFDPLCDNLELSFLWGGELPVQPCYENLRLISFVDWDHTNAFLTEKGSGLDLAEICGGEARTTQVGIRRRLIAGRNFDLVTNFDLCDRKQAYHAYNYFLLHTVLCAIMAPVCGPYGPLANLVKHMTPQTWAAKERKVRPLAIFTGRVALLQLKKGLHFIQEQPHPSQLYKVQPWPQVLAIKGVVQQLYDRCSCGLRITKGRFKGYYMKKPSSMTASDYELVKPFANCKCRGNHQHLSGDGHPNELSQAQVWTWVEARKIIQGIINIRRRMRAGLYFMYPVRSKEEVKPHDPSFGDRKDTSITRDMSPCTACKAGHGKEHWAHSRIKGECQYPGTPPFIPTCRTCWGPKGMVQADQDHDRDEGCWWGKRNPREWSARNRTPPGLGTTQKKPLLNLRLALELAARGRS